MELDEFGLVHNLLEAYNIDTYADLEQLFNLLVELLNAYANLDGDIPEAELENLMNYMDYWNYG